MNASCPSHWRGASFLRSNLSRSCRSARGGEWESVTPSQVRAGASPSGGRWGAAGRAPGAAALPATPAPAAAGASSPGLPSGCCRSVEPKETAARASTEQDGGSRVSVSPGGRGAPSRSLRAGGGDAGWGPCGRVGAGRGGTHRRAPPPRALQEEVPQPPQPGPGRLGKGVRGTPTTWPGKPAGWGEGTPAPTLPEAELFSAGSRKEGAQRSLSRGLCTPSQSQMNTPA